MFNSVLLAHSLQHSVCCCVLGVDRTAGYLCCFASSDVRHRPSCARADLGLTADAAPAGTGACAAAASRRTPPTTCSPRPRTARSRPVPSRSGTTSSTCSATRRSPPRRPRSSSPSERADGRRGSAWRSTQTRAE